MKGKTTGAPTDAVRLEVASRIMAMMLTNVQFDRTYYPLMAKDALAAADALMQAAQLMTADNERKQA